MHVHSSETIKLITPFLTQTAVIIDLPNINHIVIVDTDSNVKRLLTLINFFDGEQTKLKKPQVSVYNIQNGKAKDVAAILQQVLLSQRPPAQPATTDSITDSGRSSPHHRALRLLPRDHRCRRPATVKAATFLYLPLRRSLRTRI